MGLVTGIQYEKTPSSEDAREMTYSPVSQVMQAPAILGRESPGFQIISATTRYAFLASHYREQWNIIMCSAWI